MKRWNYVNSTDNDPRSNYIKHMATKWNNPDDFIKEIEGFTVSLLSSMYGSLKISSNNEINDLSKKIPLIYMEGLTKGMELYVEYIETNEFKNFFAKAVADITTQRMIDGDLK